MKFIPYLLLISLMLMISCTKSPEEQIIGKWVSEDGKSSVDFISSSKLLLTVKKETVHAQYEINDGKIHLLFPNGNAVSSTISINNSNLMIDNDSFIRK